MHFPKLKFSYFTRRAKPMAAQVNPGSLVLVTGVNGHVASVTALRLLQKGYRVKGTVRALKRGAYVQNVFKEYRDRFELVEVPDIAVAGAFDESLKGKSKRYMKTTSTHVLYRCRRGHSHGVACYNGCKKAGGTGNFTIRRRYNPTRNSA